MKTAKCPESLCPVSALPLLEDVSSIPARTLLPAHRSYGLIRQSHLPLLAFGYWPRTRSLRRLLPAPAANGIFPTLSLRNLPRMPGPLRRRYHGVHLPVSSSLSIGLPHEVSGSASRNSPRIRLLAVAIFDAADISLCSGLRVCSSPRSFPPLLMFRRAAGTFTSGLNVLRYLRTYRIC